MSAEQIVPGTAYTAELSVTATGSSVAPDFSTTMVTFVLDGTSTRYVFRWRPAGSSDSNFSLASGKLRFALTPAWTAANMATRDQWVLYAIVGDSTNAQEAVGQVNLFSDPPKRGTIPVGG